MLIVFQTFSGIFVEAIGCGSLGSVNDWHVMQFLIPSSTNLFMLKKKTSLRKRALGFTIP